MLSNSSIKNGYVLMNTLLVLIIFTSLIISISQLKNLSYQQHRYLLKAQENAECEYKIVQTVLSFSFDDDSQFSNECDHTIVTYEINKDTVSIKGIGKLNFSLEIIIDLEMRVVKMYNYNAQ